MRRGALGESTWFDVASWLGEKGAGLPGLFVLLRCENIVFSLLWALETGLTGGMCGLPKTETWVRRSRWSRRTQPSSLTDPAPFQPQ